jgi:multiple sugar transport system substrate-binding protein
MSQSDRFPARLTSRSPGRPMSRRAMLGLLTVAAGGVLSACVSSQPAAAPKATEPPKPAVDAKPTAQPAAPAAQPAATAAQPAAAKPAEAAKPAADAKPTLPASGQAAPSVSKKLGGELRLHMRIGSEEDTLKDVLPKFTQDTGIQVKLETTPTNEYFNKLNTLIAGGTLGDVFWCAYRNSPRFAQNKIIMPLDDLVKADKFDLSQYYDGAIGASRYQGALVAMPFKFHPAFGALYYNANQVDEAGVKMPEKQIASYDELIGITSKLTKQSGGKIERYGLNFPITTGPTNTLQFVTLFARAHGGDVYSEDGKKSLFNEQPMRDGIRFVADMMHKHKVAVPGQDISANVEDLLLAGRAATLQASSSTKSITTKTGGKFEVKNTMFPVGPSGKIGLEAITDQIVINAKTQNKEAAWELVKVLCGYEVGVRLGGGTGGTASGTCGGRRDVFHDPRLTANPLHTPFIDLVEKAEPIRFPGNLREEEVASAVHQTLLPILLGERQPDDAFFNDLHNDVQRVLDQPLA